MKKKIRNLICEESDQILPIAFKMKTFLTLIGVTMVIFLFTPATIAQKEGLTLHFDFAQEGDKVKDVSGTGNDAIIEGNSKWVADPSLIGLKGAMKFSTPKDGLKVSNVPRSLNSQKDKFSIALWFKYTQEFPTEVALIWAQWSSQAHKIEDGKLHFGISNQGAPEAGGRGLADGVYQWTGHKKDTWYHLACVYDGNEVREYIDGEKVGAVDDEGLVADKFPARFDDSISIGYPDAEVCLGDVRYYNDHVLSKTEIAKLVEEGLAVRLHSRLPVYWGKIKNNF